MDPLAGAAIGKGPATAGDPLAGATIGGAPKNAASSSPVASAKPVASTTQPLPDSPKPANTSNVFSNFLGAVASGASKVVGAVGDALNRTITPPTIEQMPYGGSNATLNALKYLPSELARQIPGVAQFQDSTDSIPQPASPSMLPFLNTRQKEITTGQASLKTLAAKIDAQKSKVDNTNKASVDSFNALVDQYNTQAADIKKKSEAYTRDIGIYNKAAASEAGTPLPDGVSKVSLSDVGHAVLPAIGQQVQGFVKMPITALADVWDAGRTFLGKNPNASFDIPGLGTISSDEFNVAEAIQQGADPVAAVLSSGSSSIFNTLFFADVVNRVAGPRAVPVAKTSGDVNTLPKPEGDTNYRAPVDVGPKSGRLYEPPTAYNKGGAQVLPPQMIDTMKSQGVKLGSAFDPSQPVFFKVEVKGSTYTGTVMQLKPSYLETAYSKLFGTKTTTPSQSFPKLLGGAKTDAPQGVNPADLGPIASEAKPDDMVPLHEQTVNEKDIVSSVNETMQKAPEPTHTTPLPPLPPPTSQVVAHNALRLAGGDTTKAQEVSQTLIAELKAGLAKHGDLAVHQALMENLGVGATQADELIKEAKTPTTPAEIKAGHDKILNQVLGARSDEQITTDANSHVEKNGPELVDKYIAEHGNFVGADEAKEFLPGYSQDRSTSDLVQKAAGQLSEAVYNKLIETKQGVGNNKVLITAGGTGAGKSTALRTQGVETKKYPVVFDTNLSNGPSAVARINKALAKGYSVDIKFVYAPVSEAYNRVIGRTEQQAREHGSGRPVSAQGHIDMHHGSYDGILAAIKEFKNNPDVRIAVYDNTGKEPVRVEDPLAFIQKISDNKEDETKLHAQLTAQREAAAQEGRISPRTNEAFQRAEKFRPRKERLVPRRVEESLKNDTRAEAARVLTENTTAIHDTYLAQPNAQEQLDFMRAELFELSVPGFRSVREDTLEPFAESSTFPHWIPEELRSMSLFEAVFKNVEKITDIKYPSNPRAFRQRELFDHILAALDYRLGVDTFKNRSAILSVYGEESAGGQASPVEPREVQAFDSARAQGGEGAQGEQSVLEAVPSDVEREAQYDWEDNYAAEYGDLATHLSELEKELKEANKKDAAALQEQIDGLNKTLGNIEGNFVYKWRNRSVPQPGGFIAPAKIAEDIVAGVNHLHDIVNHHQHVDAIVGEISNAIYKEEGANKVFKVQLTNLVTEARKNSTPKERENVYHYMEDNSIELTDNERERVLPLIESMDSILEGLRAKAREDGIYITGDILGEHTPRNAMEKGGVIDKALDAYKAGKKIISNGGKLTTSVGSGSKSRVFHSIVDESGKRTVVAIKDGKVTAFENGKPVDLGTTEQVRRPKVKEFFDDSVMKKLNQLAEDLGVTHQRVATGKSQGLGHSAAGVSFGGRDLIKTRLGPTSVLAHELGHQIDHKYGLQEVLKSKEYEGRKAIIDKELRALADKRFEDRETTEGFKKYVRKGEEKMAVMFEAYIANREMFKEVAPHLYDDFRDFLSSHSELKPFLDIQPSVSLGSEKHGGNLVSGISGKEFVDKSGNSYIVDQATTKEIEANTDTRYYKDPLANYALAIERTARAVRANELLNQIKQSEMYKNALIKVGEGDIPTDFKSTRLDQFRGYMMEPHLAEAFDDLAKRSQGGLYVPIYDEVNNLLISALVINPIMHFPNVAVGWGAATAAAGVKPELDFMDTFKQVMNKDPEYLKWVEHGAPMQYLRQTNAEFADAMLADVSADIKKDPSRYEEIAAVLGYANPIEWAKGLEHLSADATWVANDVMLFNALKTFQKANNSTYEKAIEEVTKRMADYRIPPRVLGSRALSLAMQSNFFFMFMRFHFSGVMKPWIASTYDSAAGDTAQRWAGLRTLAYFAMMWFLYQMVDKGLEKLTGNDSTYMSMAGPMRLPQNIVKSFQSGSPVPVLSSTFSLTPAVRIMGSILTGYDFSNFFKPVYGPGGEGFGAALKNQAAPYNAVEGAFTGVNSWSDFALAQGGVYAPKNTVMQSTLNGMMNLEKPQIEAQMKKLIVNGDTAGATKLAADFNNRLKVAIKASDISNGNSGSDARVQYFFDTFPNGLGQKGYAVRMPTAQSIANYEAKQGLTSGQIMLPGPGNTSSVKGKPSDINNHNDPGTIRGEVNGVTIYNRLTNASAVKAQLSGGTIQPGTQLDHIVPLEGGGGNTVDNLMVIPTAMDNINQPIEDFVGQQIKAGTMSASQAREINIRFKAGLGEPLTPALMAEYKNVYKSQPLTLEQAYDYANTVGH